MANKSKKTVYKKIRKAKKQLPSKPNAKQQTKQSTVELSKAKGRPMLVWVGKKPLERVTTFPAQKVEEFSPSPINLGINEGVDWMDWPAAYTKGGLLFHGDNKELVAHLLANGFRHKIKLIYIDPPFNTGVDYVRKITLKGFTWNGEKLQGEDYSFAEQIQYSTNWSDDTFLQFLYERLQLLKELLTEDGALFVRMDVHYGHYLKLLGDEMFGRDCFVNELIVNRVRKNVTNQGRLSIPNAVDSVYVFSTSPNYGYKNISKRLSEKAFGYWRAMDSAEVRPNPERVIEGKTFYPPPGRHFTFDQGKTSELYGRGKIRINPQNGKPEYWVEEKDYITLDSDWTDIAGYTFTTGYPTENSESLLERIITVATNPGDVVLDCFIGSGTTAAVAQRLGRRWIGCDINKGAVQTTSKRLQSIIIEQNEEEKKKLHQGKLKLDETGIEQPPMPAQYSFSVYRVNDYDLQIQHNEAMNLACEHLGVTRIKTDQFFEGTLGKNLAKIVPFNHPVTQLDLEQIKNELKARPNETRDIFVVALGKELATDAWLAGWNKLRTKGDVPNKIELIELRTDKKYGKFIEHKPATAKVSIKREKEKARIVIDNFISPTIIERLSQQEGPLRPQIKDWRSMVDCVMIDPNFDGKVFNIALSDVPEKKNDFVVGEYEIPIGKNKCTVAIKIIDMLGEEIIVTKEL